jgi:hypothetical protein
MTHDHFAEIAYDSVVYLDSIAGKSLYLNISRADPICAVAGKPNAVPIQACYSSVDSR